MYIILLPTGQAMMAPQHSRMMNGTQTDLRVIFALAHVNRMIEVPGKTLNKLDGDTLERVVRKHVIETPARVKDSVMFEALAVNMSNMQTIHPQYGELASRLLMSELYMKTPAHFTEAMRLLHSDGVFNNECWNAVSKWGQQIEKRLAETAHADFKNFIFQGANHLKSYLLKDKEGNIVERPNYMFMRIAVGLWYDDIVKALETYELMSDGSISHASPTMFNAGTTRQQLASCFLQRINPENRYVDLAEAAEISKHNGGLGMTISGSETTKFNLVIANMIKDVPQGGKNDKKRPGAGAVYREPWETDFLQILRNKRNEGGNPTEKHQDLFIGMWTPSLFIRRMNAALKPVEGATPVMWSFFDGVCADELRNCHGEVFDEKYERFEGEGKYDRQAPILSVLEEICATYKESGGPYTLFKDIINARSNHNNRGTICTSNLCTEIMEFSSYTETAVCMLGSVNVNKFLATPAKWGDDLHYDFEGLANSVKVLVRNLNRTIDINLYPSEKTKRSNEKMRPISIGMRDLQGLAIKCGLPYDSAKFKELMEDVAQTIYYAALKESCSESRKYGAYQCFEGSMYSKGIFQQDTALPLPKIKCKTCGKIEGVEQQKCCLYCSTKVNKPSFIDWEELRGELVRDGPRNSLVTAYMPTVGTSQIFGTYESFEPLVKSYKLVCIGYI